VAGVKKILLAEMAKFRAEVARDFQMVIDHQANVCAARDRQNPFRQRADFVRRRIFCAELDQIAAAVAKLLGDEFGRAAMQVGRVHEGVKFAIRERFHFPKLNNKATKEQRKTVLESLLPCFFVVQNKKRRQECSCRRLA
jgi:hypothetical protein